MGKRLDWKFVLPFLSAFAVFLFAAVRLGIIWWEYREGSIEYRKLEEAVVSAVEQMDSRQADSLGMQEKPFSVDFDKLREINPDVVGWIRMEKLGISYPIVQGNDNEYYLSHTFYKEENKCGSIFMETENSGDFNDCNTFVYGHNMKDKSMFARLNELQEEETFRDNREFYIDTPKGLQRYLIYSCHVAALGAQAFRYQFEDKEDYARWQQSVRQQSVYDAGIRPEPGQTTVTLMTCTPMGSDYRFLVHGVLMEERKWAGGVREDNVQAVRLGSIYNKM